MSQILITGSSSGIGKYLSEQLGKNHIVIGVGRKNISEKNGVYFQGDIRNENFLQQITSSLDSIEYLIVNAGVGYFDRFENLTLEQHREIIETNLLSPILLTQMLLKNNKIQKGIVCIGSICGKKSFKFGASYGASKFGIRGFAMQLKNELSSISVHLINPKIVDTNFHKNSKIEIAGKYENTSLESIYEVIHSIIDGKEKKFEIDL